jgi:hypothetical protein
MIHRQAVDLSTEWKRSDPDIVVYLPRPGGTDDQDNEHFLVIESPSGNELLAFWTQSSSEAYGDNHIMLARSSDGETWTDPIRIAGVGTSPGAMQASWQVPIVTRNGRLYCFFTKETAATDPANRQGNGPIGSLYSDDEGQSWTVGEDIDPPRSEFDNPDRSVPKSWIIWQLPIQDSKGRLIAGYTQVTSRSLKGVPHPAWVHQDSRCAFFRFENLDIISHPGELEITQLPTDAAGIEVPNAMFPEISTAQEPSVVLLPDGRLFVTMRTVTGALWYSVSDDDGESFRAPEPLRYRDDGGIVCHPMSPGPIYRLGNGRFLLLYHNNPGLSGTDSMFRAEWPNNQVNFFRNPAYIARGEYRPGAHQPIWFSQPYRLLDTEDVPIGPKDTAEIGTYTSVTEFKGRRVLWYPDRKFYLLGKYIDDDFLESIG